MALRRAVLLAVIVVLAGCTGGAPGTDTPDDSSIAQTSTVVTTTAAPTATERSTTRRETTHTATPGVSNPWGKQTLVVAVRQPNGTQPDLRLLTQDAVAFWNAHSDDARYPITLEYVPDADNPDIVVRGVDDIAECGDGDHSVYLGCASVLEFGTRADSTEVARIATGYTANGTRETITHELGHLIGLGHGDGPGDVMAESVNAVPLREPSVRERDNPWYSDRTKVYVHSGNVSARDLDELRAATEYAFGYFEAGADGYAPENFTVEYVDRQREADVVVRVVDEASCTDGAGSCQLLWGISTDAREDVLNYWTVQVIELHDVDEDTWSWRIAYHFAVVFGAESVSEYPDPLRTDEWDERRGDWRD